MNDPTPANLQPIIDLLGKAGNLTSEYQQAKAVGTSGKIAFWIGLIGTIAGTVAAVAGVANPIGAGAGLVVLITGAVVQAISSSSYSTARTATKSAAATLATAALATPVSSNPSTVVVPDPGGNHA
jgi:hypothetical protein